MNDRNYEVINLSTEEFHSKMKSDKNSILIDVRTPDEFSLGHIPNSVNIDIYSNSFPARISELEKDKSYFLYCRAGHRSYDAGVFMKQLGFEKVYHLENGILDWDKEIEF